MVSYEPRNKKIDITLEDSDCYLKNTELPCTVCVLLCFINTRTNPSFISAGDILETEASANAKQ